MKKTENCILFTGLDTGFIPELERASGKLEIRLTNDYLFRAVFLKNNKALKGLLSSLMHIPVNKITSVVVTNPNLLGWGARDKEYRLDINVLLDDRTLINLELQVLYQRYWHERSLVYLCRDFDNLSKGQDYSNLKKVIHIGILGNKNLATDDEFYSKYMFMNVRSRKAYSDRLSINVLNLKNIDKATSSDRKWGIDRWAGLMNAVTWGGRMIAKDDEYLTETANTLYIMSAEYNIRKRALEREDFLTQMKFIEDDRKKMRETISEQREQLSEQQEMLAEQSEKIAQLEAELTALKS